MTRRRPVRAKRAQLEMDVEGIRVTITRKRVKNINFRVIPPGTVSVSVPWTMSDAMARDAVRQRAGWIRRAHARMIAADHHRPATGELVDDGQQHWLWGTPHTLRILDAPKLTVVAPPVPAEPGILTLRAPASATQEQRVQVLRSFYRAQLQREIPAARAQWAPLVGVDPGPIAVRRMRSRWGSCTPRRGTIRLALQLATQPREALDYVMVHELTHLRHPGHGPRFWVQVEAVMPDWKQARESMTCPPGVTI